MAFSISVLSAFANRDTLSFLDVRLTADIADHPVFLPAAKVAPFDEGWAEHAASRVVVSCHKGGKISQGVAAKLRATGVEALILEGGVCAWRDAGLPMLNSCPDGSPWICPHPANAQTALEAWTLWRWIDPTAHVLCLSPDQMEAGAKALTARPLCDVFACFTASPKLPVLDAATALVLERMLMVHPLDTPKGRALCLDLIDTLEVTQ